MPPACVPWCALFTESNSTEFPVAVEMATIGQSMQMTHFDIGDNPHLRELHSMEAPAMPRKLISSESYLEPEIGFSRAVRVGQFVAVAGTAPIAAAGGTAAPGDVYGQTIRCLEIIAKAVSEAGGAMANIIRTRIMLTDISSWRDAARAHGEVFREIRPACTFVQVSGFIDPTWLVEIEVDCVVE